MNDYALRNALNKRLGIYALWDSETPAILGDPNGVVKVPNPHDDPTLRQAVYVQVDGVSLIAHNDHVPNIAGLPVVVTQDQKHPRLLRVNRVRRVEDLPYSASVPGHAKSHIYLHEDGGNDPVWVELRQYLPLRVSAIGGLDIHIYRSVVRTSSGWALVGDVVYSCAPNLPASGSRFLLVSLSPAGVLTYTNGSPITGQRSLLTLDNIPPIPAGHFPIAAIALEQGQTEIVESRTQTDIVDLRAFSAVTGSSLGTPGAVLFYGSDGAISSDSGNFFYNDATDTLFVGSNTFYDNFPTDSRKLHLTSPDARSLFADFVVYHNTSQFGAAYLTGRRARGTRASPAPVQEGDYIFVLSGQGYGGITPNWLRPPSSIAFVANDNWGTGVFGMRVEFHIVPKGGTTASKALGVDKPLLPGSMVRTDSNGNLSSGLSEDVEEYVRFMG